MIDEIAADPGYTMLRVEARVCEGEGRHPSDDVPSAENDRTRISA
jgi:hypothetical protein